MRRVLAVLVVALTAWGGAGAVEAAPVEDVKLTARASKAMVEEGERFTIGGTMTGVVDGERVPLAGYTVQVDGRDAGKGKAVTDGDGRYAVSFTGKVQGWFTVKWAGGSLGAIRVVVRTRLRMRVDEAVPSAGKVRLKGVAWRGDAYYSLPRVRMVIEQGRTAKGPWKAVRKVTRKPDNRFEYPFDVSVPAAKLGYWRVRYDGSEHFAPAKTAAVRTYRTKASPFRLNKSKVAYQGKVTVSGTAWYTPGLGGTAYKPFKKARLRIEQRCRGNAWTGRISIPLVGTTDAKGRFKGTYQVHCTGELRAAFYTGSGMLLGYSRTIALQVPGH